MGRKTLVKKDGEEKRFLHFTPACAIFSIVQLNKPPLGVLRAERQFEANPRNLTSVMRAEGSGSDLNQGFIV
jgi:hypothetical protein